MRRCHQLVPLWLCLIVLESFVGGAGSVVVELEHSAAFLEPIDASIRLAFCFSAMPVDVPPPSDPGSGPSASSTAGGTEFDTPLGVSSTTTSLRRPKVRDRPQGSNSVTLFHPVVTC